MNHWETVYHQLKKTVIVGLAVGGSLTAQAGYPEQVTALSPLGYWRLNERTTPGAGDIANNSGSAGAAASGYYKTANVTHPADGGLVGSSDSAAYFDGTFGNVSVPWTDGVQNLKPPFTVEFWAKPDNAPYGAVPLGNTDRASGRSGWLFYESGDRASASSISGAGWDWWLGDTSGYTVQLTGTTAIQAGTWYHVAGVYDGTNAYLYVNGALEASGAGNYAPNEAQPLTIGSRYDGTAYNFPGSVDEVAVYPSALSADQLLAHYKNGISTAPATPYNTLVQTSKPAAYYRLDEAAYAEPSTYPTAKNAGSLGADAAGAYHPGLTAGVSSASYSGFGADNYAAQFSGYQGYVALGNPAALDFTGQITLLAWVNPSSTSSAGLQDILVHGYSASSELGLRLNAGAYQVWSYDGSDHAAGYTIPAEDVGQWVFLAGTYDGTQWNLYRNGILVATNVDSVGALSVDADWAIGAKGSGDERFFNGRIDEVAIFNKALTGTQIETIFESANVPPFLSAQPQAPAGALYSGNSNRLYVVASGSSPLSYQWRKNGTAIASANGSDLVWSAIQKSDSGAYDVVVTNAYGAVTSSIVNLSIQDASAPIIVTGPADLTRYEGGKAVFAVTATGSTPLSYQWWLNSSNALLGATNSSYTIDIVSLTNAGSYSVTLSNAFGGVISKAANLTVQSRPSSGYASVVLADAPLAYWRLDETQGSVASDFLGNHDGQYLNATLGQPGYSANDADSAIRVGSVINSRIAVPGIDFASSTGFTLEAWVKASLPQIGGAAIFAKGTGAGGEQFDLDIDSGHYRFFVRNSSGATSLFTTEATPDGTWQHLVAVYDGGAGAISLYLNGDQIGTTAAPTTGLLATTNYFSIGSRQSGSSSYDFNLEGSIDEVAVYSTALSDARIAAHYQARYGSSTAPIIRAQLTSTTNTTATF